MTPLRSAAAIWPLVRPPSHDSPRAGWTLSTRGKRAGSERDVGDLHGPDPRWYIPDATPAWLKQSGSLANLRPPKTFRTPEEKRELRKSYPSRKNRYARFMAAGRCGVCGREPDRPGRAVCARCDVRMKRWNRLRAARRVQKGLCPYCGEPPLRGRKYCRACQLKFKVLHRRRKHARQYETERRRKQTRLEAGLCPRCTAPLAFGRQSCAGCLADQRAANRERKARWEAAGLCLKCGHAREDSRLHCGHCRTQGYGYKKQYRADGLCLCGRFCVPGRKSCAGCLRIHREYQRRRRAAKAIDHD